MDLKKVLNNILYKELTPFSKITFFKTEIISFLPYETKLHEKIEINKNNIYKIYKEILKNEINMEYSICLNDSLPNYDNKTNGYRLTYTISNNLDSFSNKIFFMLSKICKLDGRPNKELLPSRVIFMFALFLFLGYDTNQIQKTILKYIESIMILKKEKKTSIVFHVQDCDDIEEFEKAIKKVFIFNPSSTFSQKKFQ